MKNNKRTFAVQNGMSALPPIADMRELVESLNAVKEAIQSLPRDGLVNDGSRLLKTAVAGSVATKISEPEK
jgi:hypothetical protein